MASTLKEIRKTSEIYVDQKFTERLTQGESIYIHKHDLYPGQEWEKRSWAYPDNIADINRKYIMDITNYGGLFLPAGNVAGDEIAFILSGTISIWKDTHAPVYIIWRQEKNTTGDDIENHTGNCSITFTWDGIDSWVVTQMTGAIGGSGWQWQWIK